MQTDAPNPNDELLTAACPDLGIHLKSMMPQYGPPCSMFGGVLFLLSNVHTGSGSLLPGTANQQYRKCERSSGFRPPFESQALDKHSHTGPEVYRIGLCLSFGSVTHCEQCRPM